MVEARKKVLSMYEGGGGGLFSPVWVMKRRLKRCVRRFGRGIGEGINEIRGLIWGVESLRWREGESVCQMNGILLMCILIKRSLKERVISKEHTIE